MKNPLSPEETPVPPPRGVRLGLIGLGWAAANCHLPALQMLRAEGWPIEVAALCDLVPGRLQTAAEEWPGAALGDDAVALLDRADLDGVLILTHPDSSARLLRLAIERGRTTFVEKPVAPTLAEVSRSAELAMAGQVRVQVGYNRRYQPLAAEYARLLQRLGPQRHIKVDFWRAGRQEAGFYNDTLVHCLDFVSQHLGKLQLEGVQVWPADAPGLLAHGWRIDLGSVRDHRLTAEIDIRPAVGRDLECYTTIGGSLSITLQYPHVGAGDGRAGLTVYEAGRERVIYHTRVTNGETDRKCRLSGFLRQMAEFCQLCAGTRPVPRCGLDAAMEALRLREEIAVRLSNDVSRLHRSGTDGECAFPSSQPIQPS
ncbi:MAG: Gfo/Idh/MocA family oxidoreductase [Opitutaceae bacterium]|nr:Gfo/Idh/MocA family oxidoreductase [Opitutaceae bacterium]